MPILSVSVLSALSFGKIGKQIAFPVLLVSMWRFPFHLVMSHSVKSSLKCQARHFYSVKTSRLILPVIYLQLMSENSTRPCPHYEGLFRLGSIFFFEAEPRCPWFTSHSSLQNCTCKTLDMLSWFTCLPTTISPPQPSCLQ